MHQHTHMHATYAHICIVWLALSPWHSAQYPASATIFKAQNWSAYHCYR